MVDQPRYPAGSRTEHHGDERGWLRRSGNRFAGQSADGHILREIEVLRLAATGMKNEGIASRLGIGVRTVKGHIVDILAKMRVESRTEAAFQALKLGYIKIEDPG